MFLMAGVLDNAILEAGKGNNQFGYLVILFPGRAGTLSGGCLEELDSVGSGLG